MALLAVPSIAPLEDPTLRADFPLLARRINGRPLTYLDSAATTQKPTAVLTAMDAYYRSSNANVHRGVHTLAEEATALYEGARARNPGEDPDAVPECYAMAHVESIRREASAAAPRSQGSRQPARRRQSPPARRPRGR